MRSALYFVIGLGLSTFLMIGCFGPGPAETLDPVPTREELQEDEFNQSHTGANLPRGGIDLEQIKRDLCRSEMRDNFSHCFVIKWER